MVTEQKLLELLASLRTLRDDWVNARPDAQALDNLWDDAETALEEAHGAVQHAILLATELMVDNDAIESGDAVRLPDGSVVPARRDPRR